MSSKCAVLHPDALEHLAEDRANFVESALIKRRAAPEKLYVSTEKITEDRPGRVELELLS